MLLPRNALILITIGTMIKKNKVLNFICVNYKSYNLNCKKYINIYNFFCPSKFQL